MEGNHSGEPKGVPRESRTGAAGMTRALGRSRSAALVPTGFEVLPRRWLAERTALGSYAAAVWKGMLGFSNLEIYRRYRW